MEIRIIPMSMDDPEFVGKTIEQVQNDFFMDSLPNKENGWYYYARVGLDAKSGDLLLFQMQNQIIATAVLDMVLKFGRPTDEGNHGTYVLYKDTIKTFKPISVEELKKYIKGFESFNQSKPRYSKDDVILEELEKRINE